VRLGPGTEFDLIRNLVGEPGADARVLVGPGDDAAVLEEGWVVTCDLSVEGVHFRRDWMSPEELGGRAMRAALSDLAAMAAEPVAVLLALGGAVADHRSGYLLAVGRGARQVAEALGGSLAGGDVTRSPGPLIIDVTALGRAAEPVLRRGARVGDDVWVTGALGGAAAAVALLNDGREPGPDLRRCLTHPEPRIEVARRLAATGVLHALLDLSDGLAGDAGHLAAASEVAVEVDATLVPVHAGAREALHVERALALALHGGEDYELLFAADPAFRAESEALAHELGLTLSRVGGVHEGSGVRLRLADGRVVEAGGGWDHFGDPGGAGP
jgi:thiamine-monophosphate kinase